MRAQISLLGVICAATVNAHFVLQIPTSLGFNDDSESTAPCGSFDPADRSKGVTDWKVGGDSIGVLTTHTSVTWEFNAALVSDINTWVPLVQSFTQTGVGTVCFSGVPGFSAWVGKPAVLQVLAHSPDGILYQCAAIQFVAGGPGSAPSGCITSSGVNFPPIVAAQGPSNPATASIASSSGTQTAASQPGAATTAQGTTAASAPSAGATLTVAGGSSNTTSTSGSGASKPPTVAAAASSFGAHGFGVFAIALLAALSII